MITSPYNFVPINDKVYIPSWWNDVSLDIPFSDGEDGILEVEFTNLSPLFVRDGHASDRKTDYSSHVITENGKRRFFIPATSLKGMFRSVMEVLSFGKLIQYDDSFFGYRDFGGKDSTNSSFYLNKMKDVHAGWLKKKGEFYYLYPCEFKKIPIKKVKEAFPYYKKNKNPWDANKKNKLYPSYNDSEGIWKLVCTGNIDPYDKKSNKFSKKNEYLFSTQKGKGIVLNKKSDAINRFLTVHDSTPSFDKYISYLEEGDDREIGVFYIEDDEGQVESIGIARMFRYPYRKSIKNLVESQQKKKPGRDLCETIWGTVDGAALKGRVRISHAFCDNLIDESDLEPLASGVLGTPKASYYPLYIEQNKRPYKNYDNGTSMSGRKRYRIHTSNVPSKLPEGNSNANTLSYFKAIPSNNTFKFSIYLHNMKKVEIGALLSAISFHGNERAHHNIGMAKSFGYGKLSVMKVELRGLKYTTNEYLSAFESEMNNFSKEQMKITWCKTQQVNKLISIASEHNDSYLRMMCLNDYKSNKKNSNFYILEEPVVNIESKL